MIFKTFGKTGFKVSAIGMGTYYDPAWILASLIGIKKNSKRHIDSDTKAAFTEDDEKYLLELCNLISGRINELFVP